MAFDPFASGDAVTTSFDTVLSPEDEQKFQTWKQRYAPNDSGEDYDLRGAFKAGLTPGSDGHWPDTFKKPNHPTFSNESIYADAAPDRAGHWEGKQFVPASQFDPFASGEATPADPQSSSIVDLSKRVVRGALTGAGQVAAAADRLGGAVADLMPDWMRETDPRGTAEPLPMQQASTALKGAAAGVTTDPARDAELKSMIAEGAGAAVPAMAATAINPVAGVITLAGQTGEAERDRALAQGDSPEIAAEKAKLGRLGGAVMGVIPAGPVRGLAGIPERLATRAVTGAVVNAAQDAAMQQLVDQKLDWGRVKTAGAFGAGLGLVLGVPEALALRKALGTTQSLEGKTLGEAVQAIAAETGQPATDIQSRINEMVGVKPEAPADVTAQRRAEAETALGDKAAAELATANMTLADAAQAKTLFAARAGRQADIEAALAARDAAMAQEMARNQVGPVQSSQSLAWLHEGDAATQADAGLTSLDARLGAGEGAARERARLTAQVDAAAPSDESLPKMSAQAQRLYDEHGAINPALMFPVARAAVGGALGYAQGDTPEERVKNALLGMGFGVLASPALARKLTNMVLSAPAAAPVVKAARQRMTELRLAVAPQSLLPGEIRTQLRWGEQASRAVTLTGLSLSRDLEHAVSGIGNASARAAVAPAVKDYLEGRVALSALPAPVQVPAQKVRNYVDELSDRAVAEGVVSGTMANTFLSNRGSYLRRSYEIFLNPRYEPKPADVQAAIGAVQRTNGGTAQDAEAVVAGILDKNGRAALPDFLMGRGKVGGKDVSSLVRRQDLLPEIRTLLGEVKDPILAVNQTIPRLARLIELDAAQKQIRAIGTRLGLFSEQRSLTHPTPIVAEGSAPHDVMAGLYAPPEIAAAFQKQAGSGNTAFVPQILWRSLASLSTLAKTSKTVLNPESYAPNFIGGIISNLGNGNFRYSYARQALALGVEELGLLRQFLPKGVQRDALRSELGELVKLGVIGESVNGQDLLRTIESSFFGKLNNKVRSVLAVPAKLYGSVDDFNRYVAWQNERARYSRAFPNAPADEIKRKAAEIVRATTPVYSEIPKVVKQLSVAGLSPSFVNFTWEVFRNTKNTVKIGLQDVLEGRRTGNAALVRIGAQRLAAITAVTAGASMTGISKLSRDSNGITDEKDKAVRYFSPSWNRTGMLMYNSRAGQGRPVQYSNLSYLVPHALMFNAIQAGARGADEGHAVRDFLLALNEQFGLGNNVLIPAIDGAINGYVPGTDRKIPHTAVNPTVGDRAAYVADQAFKPLVVDWIEKFNKARRGEKGDYGRVYSTDEQIKRLLGVRAQTLDPVQAVQWKARELGNGFQEAQDIYRLRLKQGKSGDELNKAYVDGERARRAQFDEMGKMVTHARALGVSDEQTIAALRAGHLPPAVVLGVLDGRYTPMEKGPHKTIADVIDDIRSKPAQRRAAALAQLYRDDPAMGKAVIERIKSEARGTSQRDKLLLGLGVSDGERAAYLRQRLQDLGDVAARRAFLLDLRRKGILTDLVLQQMSQLDPRKAQ